ncbi:hypothetical protein [Mesorhizobium sp. LNJC391B00]|uniref:hypothetical protein n=1 Tax=Mesorhizobium sp. LNJC391B00 TaxID=1287273 RepID=UPI000412B32D|nr:hypothetical protein [Mesorhizobium sp. LNJC391B00]
MISASPENVTAKALATDLGLTARRIRQLTAAKIFSIEPTDDLYDLDRCRQRYDLYSDRESPAWNRFFDRVAEDTTNADRFCNAALKPKGSQADLQKAVHAVESMFSDIFFMVAAKSGTQAERDFVMGIWQREQRAAMQPLLWRACEIMGDRTGLSPEQVAKKLEAA